eukprot:7737917-Pyramimonas_sp.AAC.1
MLKQSQQLRAQHTRSAPWQRRSAPWSSRTATIVGMSPSGQTRASASGRRATSGRGRRNPPR